MKRVVVLAKYGSRAASTRQRFEQYDEIFRAHGLSLDVLPLLDNTYLDRSLDGGGKPLLHTLSRYRDRAGALLGGLPDADAVIVHCELFPFVPALLERAVIRQKQPWIFDFDDAIFHQYDAHRNPAIRAVLGRKLQPLLRRTSLAVCGNAYLESYAAQYCPRTEIVPTVVDVGAYTPRLDRAPGHRPVLGWIGSPSTWEYVRPLVPLLSRLAVELGFTVRIVGAGRQNETPPGFEFVPWSEESEIPSIQGMDIGMMPLQDEQWARGKCGYKLIQYMACGLPVIASPVGVNVEIVAPDRNGALVTDAQGWEDAIRRMVGDAALRAAMGADGRRVVEERYSLQVHGPRLAGLIGEVIAQSQA